MAVLKVEIRHVASESQSGNLKAAAAAAATSED